MGKSAGGIPERAERVSRRSRRAGKNAPTYSNGWAIWQKRRSSYQTIASARSRQGHQDQAVEFWERAIRLDNNLIDSHKNLAFAYASQGKTKHAVRENLALARLYQHQNQLLDALGYVQAAYALEPANPDVLSALELLRAAGVTTVEAAAEDAEEASVRGSPVDLTREKALSDLAETVFEDVQPQSGKLSKAEADALITKAIDQQTQGNASGAIDTYRRILAAGVDMPAVNFNLGLLYQENVRLDEAIQQFKYAVNFAEYRLGSLFALGELYRAKGQVDEALNYFLEALKIIDLRTVNRDQADDLIKVYESLAETYATKGEAQQAGAFVNTLVDFLSSKGWADKVAQARRRLDSLTEEGAPAISLAEILSLRDSEALLQSLSLMQELAKRGKYYSALEEAYLAIATRARLPAAAPAHGRDDVQERPDRSGHRQVRDHCQHHGRARRQSSGHGDLSAHPAPGAAGRQHSHPADRDAGIVRADRSGAGAVPGAGRHVLSTGQHREGAREISGGAGAGAARHHQPVVDESDHAQTGRAGPGTRRLAARPANVRADQEDRSRPMKKRGSVWWSCITRFNRSAPCKKSMSC